MHMYITSVLFTCNWVKATSTEQFVFSQQVLSAPQHINILTASPVCIVNPDKYFKAHAFLYGTLYIFHQIKFGGVRYQAGVELTITQPFYDK